MSQSPLKEFLQLYPVPPSKELKAPLGDQASSSTTSTEWYNDVALQINFPWHKYHLDKRAAKHVGQKDGNSSSSSSGSDAEDREDMSEEAATAVWKALENKRREWGPLLDKPLNDFRVIYSEGRIGIHGTSSYGEHVQGVYRGQAPQSWCKHYGTGAMNNYSFMGLHI